MEPSLSSKHLSTFHGDGYMIFDNLLTPEEHAYVWTYIQEERLEKVHTYEWFKAFRLTDGEPLWGPPYLSDVYEADEENAIYPTNKAIDIIIKKLKDLAPLCQDLIGEQHKDWAYFFARAYVYPANTGLS